MFENRKAEYTEQRLTETKGISGQESRHVLTGGLAVEGAEKETITAERRKKGVMASWKCHLKERMSGG